MRLGSFRHMLIAWELIKEKPMSPVRKRLCSLERVTGTTIDSGTREYHIRAVGMALREFGETATEAGVVTVLRHLHDSGDYSPVMRAHLASQNNKRSRSLSKCTPKWADRKAIKSIYLAAQKRTVETGIRHSVDHIVPLNGATVCGLHCETNLAIIPLDANIQKSNSFAT